MIELSLPGLGRRPRPRRIRVMGAAIPLLAALVAPPPAAWGQGAADSLSLAAVLALVEAGTPRTAAARAAAAAAAERISPAARLPDPELQLGLMNRELPGLGLADPLGMNQLQLMQMIPLGGKLGLAADEAREEAAGADARAEDVRWEERARAAGAYFDLYVADRSIEIIGETLRILRDLSAITGTMYAVGDARQADVLRAQVEQAGMTEELLRMEAMRAAAAARLNAVLDRPAETPVPPTAAHPVDPPLPSLDSLLALALTRRPMVTAAEHAVRAAAARERLARRELWPDLEVGLQYGWRGMDDGTERMVSLMVGARIPIWAGSRQLAMRREASAMRAMADADLREMKADTRGRVGELVAAIDRARRLGVLYAGTILPQSRATAASALSAYRVGSVDFMTVLDASLNVNRYRQAVVVAESELGDAIAELEMLTATPLLPDHPRATGLPGGTR